MRAVLSLGLFAAWLNIANHLASALDGMEAASGSARERALARVAARSAASQAPLTAASSMLALPAPTGAADEVPLIAKHVEQVSGVLPLSIGVGLQDGVCEIVLQRGTSLPARVSQILTTTEDNQQFANIYFYVGERPFCKGNRFLGGFVLAPLPSHSYRSFIQIEVVVEVNPDGNVICKGTEIEGRALGGTFAEAFWQGVIFDVSPSQPDEGIKNGGEVVMFSHALAKHLPVLLATRNIRLPSGRDIIIRQHQRREQERIGTGGVLWEAAIALADYVCRNSGAFKWSEKRVLELGAGTGLVAISLALEGAQVCATDGNPKVLEGAQENVNGVGPLPGNVTVEVFDWNSATDLQRIRAQGPWDAIVGSDLVYPGNAGRQCVESNQATPPADKMLISLLGELAGPQTQVILALKDRTGEVSRFVDLVSEPTSEWKTARAPPELIMPEFRAMPSIHVLHLHHRVPGVDSNGDALANDFFSINTP